MYGSDWNFLSFVISGIALSYAVLLLCSYQGRWWASIVKLGVCARTAYLFNPIPVNDQLGKGVTVSISDVED